MAEYIELINELRLNIDAEKIIAAVTGNEGVLNNVKLYEKSVDAIEALQKENADLIDKISKLKRKVKRLESDAAWDRDIRNGQVHGMW